MSTKKRKSYRPRLVMANPLAARRTPAPQRKADKVMLRFHTALRAMERGDHPGEAEWRDLSDAINTVETLALHQHQLVPAEIMPTITAAIAAMVGAVKRHEAGQRMGFTGEGMLAVRGVLGIYEQCLEGLSEYDMARAQAATQLRLNRILRSRRPSTQVVAL